MTAPATSGGLEPAGPWRDAKVHEGIRIYRNTRTGSPARPTLALLHGFTGHPRSWDRLAEEWSAAGHPILAPALPGHDPGSPVQPREGFSEAAERIGVALERESAGGTVLVGYSMGARVALGLLARWPRRFARALLVGGRLPPADPGERESRRRLERSWCERLRRDGLSAFLEDWERLPLWRTQRDLPRERLDHQRRVRRAHRAEELAGAIETLGLAVMPRQTEPLAAVDARVTLVIGSRDEKFLTLAVELAGTLPRADVETVAGTGHNVVIEAPHALARLVEGGLR